MDCKALFALTSAVKAFAASYGMNAELEVANAPGSRFTVRESADGKRQIIPEKEKLTLLLVIKEQ